MGWALSEVLALYEEAETEERIGGLSGEEQCLAPKSEDKPEVIGTVPSMATKLQVLGLYRIEGWRRDVYLRWWRGLDGVLLDAVAKARERK